MINLFDRVVCGVDRTRAGETAARAAARVAAPSGTLTIVSVDDSSIAVHAGWHMAAVAEELLLETRAALDVGRAEAEPIHPADTLLLEGDPLRRLLDEIDRHDATLVVVGIHDRRRAVGIAIGSVATHLIHEAPCSVLLARPPHHELRWPCSIVVGIDGSEESGYALAVARGLSARFDAPLRVLAATGGSDVDLASARRMARNLTKVTGKPVEVLRDASRYADLVVVGSRGLKGVRALGSVSERIAHEAECSVLVVREREEETP